MKVLFMYFNKEAIVLNIFGIYLDVKMETGLLMLLKYFQLDWNLWFPDHKGQYVWERIALY